MLQRFVGLEATARSALVRIARPPRRGVSSDRSRVRAPRRLHRFLDRRVEPRPRPRRSRVRREARARRDRGGPPPAVFRLRDRSATSAIRRADRRRSDRRSPGGGGGVGALGPGSRIATLRRRRDLRARSPRRRARRPRARRDGDALELRTVRRTPSACSLARSGGRRPNRCPRPLRASMDRPDSEHRRRGAGELGRRLDPRCLLASRKPGPQARYVRSRGTTPQDTRRTRRECEQGEPRTRSVGRRGLPSPPRRQTPPSGSDAVASLARRTQQGSQGDEPTRWVRHRRVDETRRPR